MELVKKIYVGKPLGLVSFETESDPLKSCHCPVLQRKSARADYFDRRAGRPGWKQMLSCGPSLAKVAMDGVHLGKVRPYYDTNFGKLLLFSGNAVR
jgi:hypothetical protein